jgi:hypothetical protein
MMTTIENKVNGINDVFPKCYLGFPALFRAPFISLLQHATSRTRPFRLAYQPPASSTFLSEQTNHQQPASSTFFSEQISTSHQPPAKRTWA